MGDIVNLGELSKPATVLIQKIGDAIEGYAKPWQIKRVAKAEAEVDLIKAQTGIQIDEMQKRAFMRFVGEEAKKQANIENITQKACLLLEENASPEKVEDDWITNFFDKNRNVSDEDMQVLWSKVLAGEANTPRTFSKKTVNLIADLDKKDAELFTRLCGFAWVIGNISPLVFNHTEPMYVNNGITFDSLLHLESLGLINFNYLARFQKEGLKKQGHVLYYGRQLFLTFPKDDGNLLPTGIVLLTKFGQELAPICGSSPVDGFFEYVCEKWKEFIPTKPKE